MTITAQEAAIEIVEQMTEGERNNFVAEFWREGVSTMLQGEWAGLDLDEVLAAVESVLA